MEQSNYLADHAPHTTGGGFGFAPCAILLSRFRWSLFLDEGFQPSDGIAQAVDELNAGERPLALYYFGTDATEQAWVLNHTLSGGVSINDVTMHPALHDAPFGGVGASGMGHYHGHEGFLEFSHARSVYSAGAHDPRREWGMLPPYNENFVQMIRGVVTP